MDFIPKEAERRLKAFLINQLCFFFLCVCLRAHLTITFPPPGEWLTLSREPTLDWAFSLKLTLWDSILTSPPPAAATRGRWRQNDGCREFELRRSSARVLTRLVLDVVLGAAFRRHFAQVHLLVEYLHLCGRQRQQQQMFEITQKTQQAVIPWHLELGGRFMGRAPLHPVVPNYQKPHREGSTPPSPSPLSPQKASSINFPLNYRFQ